MKLIADTSVAVPERNSDTAPQRELPRLRSQRILLLLSAACGVGVANIYYSQPLLLLIAHSLHIASGQAGEIAVATQLGYASGIFLFPPLGDAIDRRALMARLFIAVSVAALASALAPNFFSLLFTSMLLGLAAAVTQVTFPIAPELVAEKDRGRAVGTVMTGLLLGILLARTFSGLLGQWLGWRSVFYVAAALNLLFVPLLLRLCRRCHLHGLYPMSLPSVLYGLFSSVSPCCEKRPWWVAAPWPPSAYFGRRWYFCLVRLITGWDLAWWVRSAFLERWVHLQLRWLDGSLTDMVPARF